MSSVVYSLYLSTLFGNNRLDVTNLATCKWIINWDDLFKGYNYQYDKCRVRYSLVSEQKSDGTFAWSNNIGYLSANFASNYTSSANQNAILGLVYPQTVSTEQSDTLTIISGTPASTAINSIAFQTSVGTINGATTATGTQSSRTTAILSNAYIASTMKESGVNITPPVGMQMFQLTFMNDSDSNLQTSVPNYQILLQFELYDRKQVV